MQIARPGIYSLAAVIGCTLILPPSRGQAPEAPRVISLETVASPTAQGNEAPAPTPQAGRQAIILPSRQAQGDFRSMGGNRALAKLPNPFVAGQPAPKRGLFGHASPQASPGPANSPGMGPGFGAGEGPGGGAAGTPAAVGQPSAPGMTPPSPEAGQPSAPGTTPPPSSAAAQPAAPGAGAADAFAAAAATTGPGFGGGAESGSSNFAMIGDQSPFRFHSYLGASPGASIPQPPPVPGPRAASLFYPSMRGFKIAENMSPRPQNRVFFNFNYYNNVNDTINTNDRVPINHIQAFRYLFGWEQTFNDGKGSFGLRVPINNVTGDSNLAQGNGGTTRVNVPTSTAMGNLALFAKYILEEDPKTGSLASVGLAVTTPTGPGRFAGAPWLFGLNTVTIQPFVGYLYNYNNWYVQGFSAFDFPGSVQDVTLMYNDIGIGYYLIRSPDPRRFLTALAPTFEVHVNTPLTHRDWKNRFDIAGSPDVVNLTYGLNFQFYGTATLTTALVTPVSSPQPFNTEFAMLLNFYYGRTRSTLPVTPPPSL